MPFAILCLEKRYGNLASTNDGCLAGLRVAGCTLWRRVLARKDGQGSGTGIGPAKTRPTAQGRGDQQKPNLTPFSSSPESSRLGLSTKNRSRLGEADARLGWIWQDAKVLC